MPIWPRWHPRSKPGGRCSLRPCPALYRGRWGKEQPPPRPILPKPPLPLKPALSQWVGEPLIPLPTGVQKGARPTSFLPQTDLQQLVWVGGQDHRVPLPPPQNGHHVGLAKVGAHQWLLQRPLLRKRPRNLASPGHLPHLAYWHASRGMRAPTRGANTGRRLWGARGGLGLLVRPAQKSSRCLAWPAENARGLRETAKSLLWRLECEVFVE